MLFGTEYCRDALHAFNLATQEMDLDEFDESADDDVVLELDESTEGNRIDRDDDETDCESTEELPECASCVPNINIPNRVDFNNLTQLEVELKRALQPSDPPDDAVMQPSNREIQPLDSPDDAVVQPFSLSASGNIQNLDQVDDYAAFDVIDNRSARIADEASMNVAQLAPINLDNYKNDATTRNASRRRNMQKTPGAAPPTMNVTMEKQWLLLWAGKGAKSPKGWYKDVILQYNQWMNEWNEEHNKSRDEWEPALPVTYQLVMSFAERQKDKDMIAMKTGIVDQQSTELANQLDAHLANWMLTLTIKHVEKRLTLTVVCLELVR